MAARRGARQAVAVLLTEMGQKALGLSQGMHGRLPLANAHALCSYIPHFAVSLPPISNYWAESEFAVCEALQIQ
jgi:hypothetical protein